MLTVSDWLRRAHDAHTTADMQGCLESAAALAQHCYQWRTIVAELGDLPRAAGVATGYHRWLGDTAAADRIGLLTALAGPPWSPQATIHLPSS